ncbi:polar amino acid transport system ATP-binding protein [Pantoea sp. AN62]|uniref:amino acid ABC transporter ATP-binding protein n=1 Tax=Pantoea TaxID=53335 RepID=UPI000A225508|nr:MULTISPECIES: amino acid ABC transporter ATP-binding protein [Pantoea]MBS6438823.1 amino acid ABC transporter ATP-binding protein [Pantoea sp.]MCG7391211.1 amino acid ABC transporter ATP-binding protein [Pantoea sp. ACRSB]MCQ5473229.1 amino acid ABC transporter ATP-binding protein [Pantoea brenneri]MDU1575933.1 amino acid ABC transporter ATP-binding protein [Pantoea sp.]MDU2731531.1 amino acid ABC transporter ATP-binding protein [Pantoea sp.]
MHPQPILELRRVGKSFADNRVLADINLTVSTGEIVTLIGPSGSGKTTALRCMNFLEAYDEGDVLIKGQLLGYSSNSRSLKDRDSAALIAEVRRPLAMVFQQFNLWPHMTVLENVCAPLILGKKTPRDVARKKAVQALAQVGMAEKASARPARLSGGQQQRVGIARALALEPELMLLDEPTSALDPERVEEVQDVVKALANDGMTMVMVTHEMSFAAKISSRMVFMAGGSIIESGAPDKLFRQPQTDRLKNFLAPWFKRPLQLDEGEINDA